MSEVYCIINRAVVLSDTTPKVPLQAPLAYDNAMAHCMRVTLYNDDGTDADLTGVGVVASMLKADGNTVSPINGTTSGNVAEVILPASCYVTPGRFKFTMNLSKTGGYTRTVLWVEGMVERNVGGTIIDPGTPVGNIEQAIGNANAAASAATAAAASVPDLKDSIAPDYADLTFPVAVDQLCWHGDTLYKANTAIATSEEWTAAHWTQTSVEANLLKASMVATTSETETYLGIE